jgi:hypothetical protein
VVVLDVGPLDGDRVDAQADLLGPGQQLDVKSNALRPSRFFALGLTCTSNSPG